MAQPEVVGLTDGNNTSLDGVYKTIYPEGIRSFVEFDNYYTSKIPFKAKFKLGGEMKVPLMFQKGQSFKHFARGNGKNINTRADSGIVVKQISFDAYNTIYTTEVDLEAIMRAMTSTGAFKQMVSLYQGAALDAAACKEEETLLYGGKPKCQFTSSVNTNATTTVITAVAIASGGHWSSMMYDRIGAFVNFFSAGDDSVIGQDTNQYKITATDMVNETLTVTGSAADIVDLDQFLATTTDANMYFDTQAAGATSKEFDGIDKCAALTTGNLFGQDVTAFDTYIGNRYNINGAISFDLVTDAVARIQARMFKGKLTLGLHPTIWARLMQDQAALRRYPDANVKSVSGFEALEFSTGGGRLEIVSHPYIKRGFGLIIPDGALARGGAADWTDMNPVGGPTIQQDPNNAAIFLMYLYNNKFMYVEGNKLQHMMQLYGITG